MKEKTQQIPAPQAPQAPTPVVKKFPKFDFKSTGGLIVGAVAVVILGVGSGWLLSGKGKLLGGQTTTVPGAETGPKEAGLADEATFRDSAEGILEEGGINGEGTHRLVRPGGESQNVYLTSTVIDLQSFVGKKVKIWGETISAKKAGWLMDVGKVKVIE
ncbi:hypothetical protein HY503_00225 [Candidatus Woesebacteria bacterium]|nr:hypothetical protein [Candidatus Woesebacteria bacterium]